MCAFYLFACEEELRFLHFSFEVNSVVNAKCHAIYYKMTQHTNKTELMLRIYLHKIFLNQRKKSANSSFIGSDRFLINIGWLKRISISECQVWDTKIGKYLQTLVWYEFKQAFGTKIWYWFCGVSRVIHGSIRVLLSRHCLLGCRLISKNRLHVLIFNYVRIER